MITKEYKVGTLTFYLKLMLDRKHIAKSSKQDIREKLDGYAAKGYKPTLTDFINFGATGYISVL